MFQRFSFFLEGYIASIVKMYHGLFNQPLNWWSSVFFVFSKKSKPFFQVILYLAHVSLGSIPRTKIAGSRGKMQLYFCTFSCYCLILFYRNCAILHWEGFLKGFCKCSNLIYSIVGKLRHSSKSEVIEWTYTLFLLVSKMWAGKSILVFAFFFFCLWRHHDM